jgi:predicted DNA-binding protein
MKNNRITIRFDDEEFASLSILSREAGKTESAYIRDCIKLRRLKYTVSVFDELKNIQNELGRIGNNLNQLTRYAHSTKQCQDISDTLKNINQLQRRIERKL